jgi:hypothetical protein
MKEAGLEIGVASVPLLIPHRQAQRAEEMPVVARNTRWIAGAVLIFTAFALTLGRGYTV